MARGRPRKYLKPDELDQLERLAGILTIDQIGEYFGFGRTTFFRMRERDPKILERYQKGRARAIGSIGSTVFARARKGDMDAARFYLRTQAGWSEKNVLDLTSSDGSMRPKDSLDAASPDELRRELERRGLPQSIFDR
jgi:hypothetical protein